MNSKEAVRVPEAAALLSIGLSKLWELIRGGELRVIRFGRAVRVPMSEVRRLAEEGIRSKETQTRSIRVARSPIQAGIAIGTP
jgi:excisionase family DNA binding protein